LYLNTKQIIIIMVINLLINFFLWLSLSHGFSLHRNIKQVHNNFKLESHKRTYNFSERYTEQLLKKIQSQN
jgi:hypothetical protein